MNGLNSKLLKQVSVRHLNISKGRKVCLKCIRKSADKNVITEREVQCVKQYGEQGKIYC